MRGPIAIQPDAEVALPAQEAQAQAPTPKLKIEPVQARVQHDCKSEGCVGGGKCLEVHAGGLFSAASFVCYYPNSPELATDAMPVLSESSAQEK